MWHVEQLRPSMVAKQIVHDWASNELPHYAEPERMKEGVEQYGGEVGEEEEREA